MADKKGKADNPEAVGKYTTTFQTERYRQQCKKEQLILQSKTKSDIQKLDEYFNVNNNYLALYRKEGIPENTNATKPSGFLATMNVPQHSVFHVH
jgi:hypothetical protein